MHHTLTTTQHTFTYSATHHIFTHPTTHIIHSHITHNTFPHHSSHDHTRRILHILSHTSHSTHWHTHTHTFTPTVTPTKQPFIYFLSLQGNPRPGAPQMPEPSCVTAVGHWKESLNLGRVEVDGSGDLWQPLTLSRGLRLRADTLAQSA